MLKRLQFSLGKVLLLVGLLGALLGLAGRGMHQQREHRRAEAELAECQQATKEAYLRARTQIGHSLRPHWHRLAGWSRQQQGSEFRSSWREQFSLGRYVNSNQRQLEMLLHVEVEAVLRSGALEPIIVRDCGAIHNEALLDTLMETYRCHRWPYRIIEVSEESGVAD